jgi:Icc-related predicted phosphoesterase
MALGPGEQMLHPETGETARVMERQDLTRSPWQTFRFDSDGCIACVGQPTLVLTGTARAGGIMYLHRKCDELMRQGLQQWEPMETRQSLPLSPAPGELPRTLCQLRLQHHSFYVDFNMLQQASEPPIMYPQRDKPNQLLILEPQTVRILHHSVTHSPHREILDLPAAADAAAVPSDVSDCWDAYRHTGKKLVTLLHISDTHMLHRTLRPADLPAADILVHTGDFTNNGTDAEFEDFNNWLASQRPRFKHIVIICGNHEFRTRLQSPDVLSRDFAKKRLSNATHVLHHEMAVIEGIRFFGSPWSPWSEYENPDIMPYNAGHADVFKRWAKLPEARDSLGVLRVNAFDQITRLPGAGSAIDVLLTHGPPHGIFDKMETTTQSWGSSRQLRARIEGVGGVGAHLFGHVHEQRGCAIEFFFAPFKSICFLCRRQQNDAKTERFR